MENISDFILQSPVDEHMLTKYAELLPEKLLQLWKEAGFGSLVEGYLKVVNPDEYADTLKEVYSPVFKNPLVIFATGLSDLIVWENNYTVLLNCRYGISKVIESGFKYFLEDVYEKDFLEEELKAGNYFQAKEGLGNLNFDECFGYVPLLSLGGTEKAQNLQKVKLKEHISIIAQAGGKIE